MPNYQRFRGLFPAAFTPFTLDGKLNISVIEQYANMLAKENLVSGVFISGTSGESMSLSVSERKMVAEEWVKCFKKYNDVDLRAIVHVGTPSIEDAMELARHAQMIGAHGIACMAPIFFKPRDVDTLVQYCHRIASCAPDLPFLYYHFPDMTGVPIPVSSFLERASKVIPNLAGAKFTDYNLYDLGKSLQLENGRFDILFGHDTGILAAASMGCKAGIGISYSLYAPIYKQIFDLMSQDGVSQNIDKARKLQEKSINLFKICEKVGADLIPMFKVMMKEKKGIDFGPVRQPLKELTSSQIEQLKSELASFD